MTPTGPQESSPKCAPLCVEKLGLRPMSLRFEIEVQGTNPAESQSLAAELAAVLRLTAQDIQVDRTKRSDQTMDLGTVIGVVVASGAATAVARGVAAWLAKRQSAEITILKDGAIKAKRITSAD